jgi:glycosyltransferase involved in cell wall biosynthesis
VSTVSVVIPARDAAATIGRTLHCVLAQEHDEPYEVIVVDDGSTDRTPHIARAAGGTVRVIHAPGEGPAGARNRGAAASSAPVLAFTDADCYPEPGWLRAGLRAIARAELVQGKVIPDPRAPRGPFDRTISVGREHGLYETANLFVRRPAFDAVGGFEDWLPVRIGKPLAEDVWLGWRVRRAGMRTAFAEDALVHHAVFPRGAREMIAEQLRVAYFPAMVRKVPELRETFLTQRVFLTPRSAAFDFALAGGVLAGLAAAAGASPGLAAAVRAAPWASATLRDALRWGRWAPWAALAYATRDAVGCAALAWGSLRSRCLVI